MSDRVKVIVRVERRVSLPNYEHEIVSVMAETFCSDTDEARLRAQKKLFSGLRAEVLQEVKTIRRDN